MESLHTHTHTHSPLSLSLSLSLSLFIRPDRTSLWASPLEFMLCPHRADVCKSFLVGTHWSVRISDIVLSSPAEPRKILIVSLGWFEKRESCGRAVLALWGTASKICSKQQLALFCSSNTSFSTSVSLESLVYIYIYIYIPGTHIYIYICVCVCVCVWWRGSLCNG